MNRIFECSGIPQILEPRQEIVAKHLTIPSIRGGNLGDPIPIRM